jgi:hypothetical protein
MQVSIEPSRNIQSNNDRPHTYTWHGSTDMYQIGESGSRLSHKVSLIIQIGCNSINIANLLTKSAVNEEIASNKSQCQIDFLHFKEVVPIAAKDSADD